MSVKSEGRGIKKRSRRGKDACSERLAQGRETKGPAGRRAAGSSLVGACVKTITRCRRHHEVVDDQIQAERYLAGPAGRHHEVPSWEIDRTWWSADLA